MNHLQSPVAKDFASEILNGEKSRTQREEKAGMELKIQLEVISDPNEFMGLRKTWKELLSKCDPVSPFFEFDWLESWWRCFGQESVLKVLKFKNDREILGVVPMIITKRRMNLFPVKILEFMGTGWGQNHFLVIREKPLIFRLMLEWLKDHKDLWDVVSLSRLSCDPSDIHDLQETAKQVGLFIYKTEMQNPYIPVKALAKEGTYLQTQSKNFRKLHRQKTKKLKAFGNIKYESYTDNGLSGKDMIKKIFFPIVAKSWKGQKGVSALSHKSGVEFYERIIPYLQEKGQLDLSVLKVNDIPSAFLLGIKYLNRFFAIDTGYDGYFSEASPGMLLHAFVIEKAFQAGFDEFDFGYMHPYKTRWTSHFRKEYHLNIYSKRVYSSFFCFLQSYIKPAVKKVIKVA